MEKLLGIFLLCMLIAAGCEDTNLRMATQAGMDAIKAITLSKEEVEKLAQKTAAKMDQKHRVAHGENKYAQRLKRLTSKHKTAGKHRFEYKVYISDKVNAFALGDGTIRIYSGLMEMMNDDELRFVLGHEMGHVVEKHIKKKMEIALASSAVRKGLASQQNIIGDLARSTLGSFMQTFLNAQFSQEEEKAADDYGLQFMQKHDYNPKMAVSSLEKFGTLGKDHSFLSSHPAPEQRAERLQEKLRSPEKASEKGLIDRVLSLLHSGYTWIKNLWDKMMSIFQQPT